MLCNTYVVCIMIDKILMYICMHVIASTAVVGMAQPTLYAICDYSTGNNQNCGCKFETKGALGQKDSTLSRPILSVVGLYFLYGIVAFDYSD